ncbi:MAG TPA: EVE domain-containing protein [Candidatus Paceibacterota bacterium]|jgi:predicted RNA-binding protein with PUA-like domain|nr:EVE domain-containing protein [Candidatus Paceibacterota bacterium]
MKKYWLLKSEPSCYSIDDLAKDKTALWTGVRNFQARNFLRDMKVGDLVLFYHSSEPPMGVFGVAKIAAEAVPDTTALDKEDDHYDPKATKENPIWFAPKVAFSKKFKSPVTLSAIKFNPKLEGIMVAAQGSRLSVQPVSKEHFEEIVKMSST